MAPDGMPTLSRGHHARGSGQACVMEYVSVLAGEEWSDTPRATNPAVAQIARGVNDTLTDEDRPLLVPLIGRLLAAHVEDNGKERSLSSIMEGWQATAGLFERYTRWSATYAVTKDPSEGIAVLTECLDKYDMLTNRCVKVTPVSEDRLAATAQAIGEQKPVLFAPSAFVPQYVTTWVSSEVCPKVKV